MNKYVRNDDGTHKNRRINDAQSRRSFNRKVWVDYAPCICCLSHHRRRCRVKYRRRDIPHVCVDSRIIQGILECGAKATRDMISPCRCGDKLDHGAHAFAEDLDIDLGCEIVGIDERCGQRVY